MFMVPFVLVMYLRSSESPTRWHLDAGKGKVNPYTGLVALRGSRGIALLILNLSTRRGWVVSTTPRPLYPRERPGTHCRGGWVGPRDGLDMSENSRPTGIRSQIVQLVVSRYTD